jgi:hypothetical protein
MDGTLELATSSGHVGREPYLVWLSPPRFRTTATAARRAAVYDQHAFDALERKTPEQRCGT